MSVGVKFEVKPQNRRVSVSDTEDGDTCRHCSCAISKSNLRLDSNLIIL